MMTTNVAKWLLPGSRLRLLNNNFKSCTLSKIKTGWLFLSSSSSLSLVKRIESLMLVFCTPSFENKSANLKFNSSFSCLMPSAFFPEWLQRAKTASVRLDKREVTLAASMVITSTGLLFCFIDSNKRRPTCLASSDLPEPGPPIKYTWTCFPSWSLDNLFISRVTLKTSSRRHIQRCLGGHETSL